MLVSLRRIYDPSSGKPYGFYLLDKEKGSSVLEQWFCTKEERLLAIFSFRKQALA